MGHVVHDASDAAQFVHLTVLRGGAIDNTEDFVIPDQEDNIELRVTVGEHPEALYFKIGPEMRATCLINNLHVLPYEQVIVTASRVNARCIIHGYCTSKPSNH